MKEMDEIEKLVDLVAASGIHEITARVGDRRITIAGGRPLPKKPALTSKAEGSRERRGSEGAGHPASPESPGAHLPSAPTTHQISAPMVGVFHHADPPVTAGMAVKSGQVIALIESMKLMNDIRSEVTGTVMSMHVDDGLAVEYAQPLFEIAPAGEESDDPQS